MVSSGGGNDGSVAELAGGVTRGEATDLGARSFRGEGFATASAGGLELGRAAGVFSGVGTMGRGVVCGTRSGVDEVTGAAGVKSGLAMTGVDSAGGTVCAGEGFW